MKTPYTKPAIEINKFDGIIGTTHTEGNTVSGIYAWNNGLNDMEAKGITDIIQVKAEKTQPVLSFK